MPRPLIVGLAVALFGLVFVAWGYTNPAGMCTHRNPHGEWYPNGDPRWLPPGAHDCHRHADGRQFGPVDERTTALPWHDWITVLLIATSAGLLVAALRARRRRIVRAAGAYALFLVATLGWFFEHPLVWAALLAIASAAVMSARRWDRGRWPGATQSG